MASSGGVETYEYIFYLSLSEWLWPPTRRKAQGLLLGSCTMGRWLRSKKFRYDSVPFSGKRLGTTYLVPDMAPPLLTEDEGPPT
jgi:hypothetical protein